MFYVTYPVVVFLETVYFRQIKIFNLGKKVISPIYPLQKQKGKIYSPSNMRDLFLRKLLPKFSSEILHIQCLTDAFLLDSLLKIYACLLISDVMFFLLKGI